MNIQSKPTIFTKINKNHKQSKESLGKVNKIGNKVIKIKKNPAIKMILYQFLFFLIIHSMQMIFLLRQMK